MSDWNERFYEMMEWLRQSQTKSKAAAVIKAPCDMIVTDNPGRDKNSKAASSSSSAFSSEEELFASAPPGPVPDRIRQKLIQTAEGPAKVTSYEYERQGSSSGDQVYQCGTDNFETKNVKEFNNHINRTHNDSSTSSNSKAASSVSSANKARVIAEFLKSNHY